MSSLSHPRLKFVWVWLTGFESHPLRQHALKFKKRYGSGLVQLIDSIAKIETYIAQLISQAPSDGSVEQLRVLQRRRSVMMLNKTQREAICVSQALGAMALVLRVGKGSPPRHGSAATFSFLQTGKGSPPRHGSAATFSFLQEMIRSATPELATQWSEVGMLVGWESLLSTHGSENGMLGDMWGAVLSLHSLQVSWLVSTNVLAHQLSDQLTS